MGSCMIHHQSRRKASGAAAKAMGAELPHGSAGGGSGGNFTGCRGNPDAVDGLGVRGADAHTLNEHIEIDSLARRWPPDGRIAPRDAGENVIS